jgi:hypothetical protein
MGSRASTTRLFYPTISFTFCDITFIRGKGEFQVDDLVFGVSEGSVVRVDPEGERCMQNISDAEELCFIVVQSRVGSYADHTIEDGFGVQKRVSWVGKERL